MAFLDGVALPPRWRIMSRLLAGWPIDDRHMLELWPCGRAGGGRLQWLYRLSSDQKTIFNSTDIMSPVGTALSGPALVTCARTVLAFLTLCPGDTDAEYFDGYTSVQLDWRDRHAEELSLYALDGVCGYCGGDHLSPGCFR